MPAATEVITLRISAAHKAMIDAAASCLGQTRTAFILEDTLCRAENILMEQKHFTLSPEQWRAFEAALDAPAASNPALRKLLETPAPWEK